MESQLNHTKLGHHSRHGVLRRPVVVAVSLALLLGFGYGAYWMMAVRALSRAIDDWAGDRVAHGWTVSHGEVVLSGFPTRLIVSIPQAKVTSPHAEWEAESVSIAAWPFDTHHLRFVWRGRHHLSMGASAWDMDARQIRAAVRFSEDPVRLTALNVTASDVRFGPEGSQGLSAEALGLSLVPGDNGDGADRTKPAYTFIATAAGLEMGHAPESATVEASEVSTPLVMAEARGRIMGDVPLTMPAESLSRWSAGGGTLELDQLVVDWPPIALEGEGTLAFDPNMQPVAAFSTRMRGVPQFLDILQRSGVIDASTADSARGVAMAQSKPDSKGRGTATMPLTIQDGKVWLGGAAISTIPALRWQ